MNITGAFVVAGVIALPGCVGSVTGSTYYDGRFWYSNVKSASDAAGGPRQDLIVVLDRDGRIVNQFQASGPGTLQSLVGSLAPAVATGAGQAMAGAWQRPARNTTDVRMDVQGTGGTGGSNTTSATATSPTTTNSSSSATGGNAAAVTAP